MIGAPKNFSPGGEDFQCRAVPCGGIWVVREREGTDKIVNWKEKIVTCRGSKHYDRLKKQHINLKFK